MRVILKAMAFFAFVIASASADEIEDLKKIINDQKAVLEEQRAVLEEQ